MPPGPDPRCPCSPHPPLPTPTIQALPLAWQLCTCCALHVRRSPSPQVHACSHSPPSSLTCLIPAINHAWLAHCAQHHSSRYHWGNMLTNSFWHELRGMRTPAPTAAILKFSSCIGPNFPPIPLGGLPSNSTLLAHTLARPMRACMAWWLMLHALLRPP